MATVEERVKVLTMIQEGKISPDEGIQLLEMLDKAARTSGTPAAPATSNVSSSNVSKANTAKAASTAADAAARAGARWFRVLVTDTNTGKTRVNVRMPISMVSAGMKMGARFAPQVEGLDAEQLMEFLHSGEIGRIVDVYDEEDGEHVEVFIE
jgi:hypothetical protein